MIEQFKANNIENTWLYFFSYFVKLFKGIARTHSPVLESELPALYCDLDVKKRDRKKWCRFFKTQKSCFAPFSYHIPISSQVIVEYTQRLKISYKNILFACSDVDILSHDMSEDENVPVKLKYSYSGAESVNRSSSLARFTSCVLTDKDNMLFRQTDYFYVKKAKSQSLLNDETTNVIRTMRYRKRELSKEHHKIGDFYIWRGMGVHFGAISGDFNLTHIFDVTARILGKCRAFIQGLCTLNIVISLFWDNYPHDLANLKIYYAKPIYHDQMVHLLCDGENFELINDDNELLAFGKIKHRNVH